MSDGISPSCYWGKPIKWVNWWKLRWKHVVLWGFIAKPSNAYMWRHFKATFSKLISVSNIGLKKDLGLSLNNKTWNKLLLKQVWQIPKQKHQSCRVSSTWLVDHLYWLMDQQHHVLAECWSNAHLGHSVSLFKWCSRNGHQVSPLAAHHQQQCLASQCLVECAKYVFRIMCTTWKVGCYVYLLLKTTVSGCATCFPDMGIPMSAMYAYNVLPTGCRNIVVVT